MGCWTRVEQFVVGDWQAELIEADGSQFKVLYQGQVVGEVNWSLLGLHNVHNALAALAAARHVGVPIAQGIAALPRFKGVKRRMQLRGQVRGVSVYDDFAHHPTAIATTLAGLRAKLGQGRILALLEPRSNTMRLGTHKEQLANSLKDADQVWLYQPAGLNWDLQTVLDALGAKGQLQQDIDTLAQQVAAAAQAGDHILIMSNGGFEGIHDKVLAALANN
jgi:UDP-N-acetylmuramate: L-alanyl-gamma-D-glutamyl-meso-diaminopimelate ligase